LGLGIIFGYTTNLRNALQGTVEAAIAVVLGVIDVIIGHLRDRRKKYAHGSARKSENSDYDVKKSMHLLR